MLVSGQGWDNMNPLHMLGVLGACGPETHWLLGFKLLQSEIPDELDGMLLRLEDPL